MARAPQAEPGTICPLHKRDVSKVCHTCAWYIQVRGKNPQTGADIDSWGCAIAYGPMMTLEGARQSRSTASAVEMLRNEVVSASDRRAHVMEEFNTRIAVAKQRIAPSTDQGMPCLEGRQEKETN